MSRIRDAISALRGVQGNRGLEAWEMIMRDRGWSPPAATRVDQETALRHSGVWACRRLRANVLGMLPVDGYRKIDGVSVEVPLPEVFRKPYPGWTFGEWRWAASWDRDGYGNSLGIVHATDALGRPAVIESVSMSDASIIVRDRAVKEVRVNGEIIPLSHVWLETLYRPAGSPLGLSPIVAAAWSIGGYLAAQKYGLEWYDNDKPMPKGTLRNTERSLLDPAMAKAVRDQFKASVAGADIFVTGRDWEWTPEKIDFLAAGFIEMYRWGIADICRFMDVPGDLIDASQSGSSVTYARIDQRNLQFLVMSLQSAITRDENRLSDLLAAPRVVRFNTSAILRLDELTRQQIIAGQITSRVLAPSEARAIEDRPPFTEDQLAEFDRLFPSRGPVPVTTTGQWEAPK